ncbi:MAG: PAS domain S-box protein [Candidatus Methylacidiphilales bacterium]|nr:PAS domain S-box protein [Candidatus Methylacidiphilales bacterium]
MNRTEPPHPSASLTEDLPPESSLRAFLALSPLVGRDFFASLVTELCRCLDVKHALVAQTQEGPGPMLETVAVSTRSEIQPNFVYPLRGTPCENVLGRVLCHYPSGIRQRFPDDILLTQMGVESYVGIPLFDTRHNPIGLVAILHDQPLENRPDIGPTLTLFASRAGAELSRLRAEADIGRNEARYRSILNSLGEGILIYHRSGTLLSCNPSACTILGLSEEILKSIPYNDPSWKLCDADGSPLSSAEFPIATSFRTGQPVHDSIIGLHTNRRGLRWLQINATPVSHNHPDDTDLVTVSFYDITERRASEYALRLSEERFRTLVQHSPDAIVVIDAHTLKFVDHNPQAQSLLLMSSQELRNCGPIEVSPELQPDGMPSAEKAMAVIQSAVRGKNIIFEWLLRRKTGENLLCEFRLIRLPSPDRVLLRGSITDITERRRSQERFRIMAEQTGQLVYEYDITAEDIVWSGAIYRVTGYSPEDFQKMNIERWAESIHPDDRDHSVKTLEHVIRHGNRYDVAYRFRRQDGSWIYIEDHGVVLRDENGRPTIMLGTMKDVTDQKRHEEATRALENQLRHSQKMEAVGTLAGGVAHDFNNILGAIIGYTDLACMELPDSHPARSHLDESLKASQRARDLVRQILTFSRRQLHEPSPIALADCIEESTRLLRATFPASIRLSVEIETRPTIMGDYSQIQQILINLATNASHALDNNIGHISLALHAREVESHRPPGVLPGLAAGPYAEISVSDNGHGMDTATLKRIFEPFFTTKKPGEGTGLGLAVVHGIVNEHHGGIEVESEPGVGTTFRVLLPVAQGTGKTEQPSTPSLPGGGGQRILLVDDEIDLTKVMGKILTRLGYQATIYNDPIEALTRFRSSADSFDLVMVDLNMPGMTGIDLAKAIHQIKPALPILLVTGYGGDWTQDKVAEFGIRAVVSKPVTFQQLASLLHQYLTAS